jgi:hypothetical protein
VFACVALIVGSAQAQGQQPPQQGRQRGGFGGGGFGGGGFGGGFGGRGGMGGGGLLMYANIEAVQKEIEALDEQVADIKKLQGEQQAQFQAQIQSAPQVDFQSLSDEERTKMMTEFRERAEKQTKETNAKLEEILLPNQVKRIKEIMLQQQGIRALNNPEVVAELEITADQTKQLEDLNTENGEAMRKLFTEAGANADREAMGVKMRELNQANEEKLLAVLTDDQKSEFETMKGEKFEMPEGAFGRGGFGGGRGGRGGPGGAPGGRPQGERPAAENQ